jgi:hypothetical protein
MTPKKNVAIEPDILERAEQIAQAEGKTVDELANEAMKRELARRFFERNRRDAELRRESMTDDEVDTVVDTAIHEWRAEQRAR